jgi:hypothetical protein
MADHSKPTLASTYTNFITEVDGRLDDLAMQYDPARTTVTNPQTFAIRWSSASSKWQVYNGSTWGDLVATYAINVATADALATGRTISTTGDATGTSAAFTGAANLSFALTLATVNSNVGSFGSANGVASVTVNAKGLVTAASTVALTSGTSILRGNNTGGMANATASELVAAIGATAVTNATNATNATTAASCSGNAATATYSTSIPSSNTAGTLVAADAGKCVSLSAGITVPASIFSTGQAVTIYNNTGGNLTILQGSGLTLRQGGSANTGNRTLAQRGLATVWYISATEAVMSGSGVS